MRSKTRTRPWPASPTEPEGPGTEIQLIHDWNETGSRDPLSAEGPVRLHDETLRDGLQGSALRQPSIGTKLEVVHLLDRLGIYSVDTGLPGASQPAYEHSLRICEEIARSSLSIRPTCAGRTMVSDIQPMAEISQATGRAVEVMTFIGVSQIRQFTEGWSSNLILRRSINAIDFAVREGLPVTFVTEDTTRSDPVLLQRLATAALDHGASRLCLCDTVGHASPTGVARLLSFFKRIVTSHGADAKIDWHGHNDRGLALANALTAREHGADRLHGCVLGLGERVGNTSLDLLLVNLQLSGVLPKRDLSPLRTLAEIVSDGTGQPIPRNYPVLGDGAFMTATGVHAAAIRKARKKGSEWLADRVYSSVPAELVGRKQEIRIGPLSGVSNVSSWLEEHQVPESPKLVEAILTVAKSGDHDLTDGEVMAIVERHDHRQKTNEAGRRDLGSRTMGT